jgi:hypothetical protein
MHLALGGYFIFFVVNYATTPSVHCKKFTLIFPDQQSPAVV